MVQKGGSKTREEVLASIDAVLTEGADVLTAKDFEGIEKRVAGLRAETGEAANATAEVRPESSQAWLGAFKTRFDTLPQLHKGVEWADVARTLQADPEARRKLKLLDEAGFEMNVFGEENGKIVFRTAQTDVMKIASQYRTIMADRNAQTDYSQYSVNGNAEEIAAAMGVEVADPELYEQYRVKNGWVWLKTDDATRATGSAFFGYDVGVSGRGASFHNDNGSFCAALRVYALY